MSLIAYRPQEGREIVLRHRDAIVVRDSTSHRLEIRGLTECPTCRRPLPRGGSAETPFDEPFEANHESYVNPDYFRMLQSATQDAVAREEQSSNPSRGFLRPPLAGSRDRSSTPASTSGSAGGVDQIQDRDLGDGFSDTSEFVYSQPSVSPGDGNRIRRQAFSPGYFKTFFKEERVLGRGGKGVVLLVRHEIDNCDLGHFACKRVPVGDDHDWLEKVLSEVGLLNRLSHPNLVSYRHVWLESVKITRFGPKVACAFILQQYCNGGDLHQYVVGGAPREATKEELKAQMRRRSRGQAEMPTSMLNGNRQLSFDEIYSLFKDIASGVAYLHSNNFIHRDLKPSNCLLHREGGKKLRCLISDFGEVQAENVVRKSSGSTGTISYCAPEVLKSDASGRYNNFTTKSDIFSLGMILYFMCFGKLPYRNANTIQEELEDIDELRTEIGEWKGFQAERKERTDLPSRLYKLLKMLLSLDPAERPSASEVLSVMRREHVEGMDRPEQPPSPSLGLQANRVQNLDSPAGGRTPEPSTPRRESVALADGEVALQSRSASLQPHPLAIAHSSESYDDDDVAVDSSPAPGYDSLMERDQDRSPPLLMAPPRTGLQGLRDNVGTYIAWLPWFLGLEEDILNHSVRMVFFIIKLLTLYRSCWPYIVRLEVGIPLLVIAALDLRVPDPLTSSSSSPSSSLARRNRHGEIEFGPSPTRGLAWSLALVVLHLAALWMARRYDTLCLHHHEEQHWEEEW